VDMVLSILTAIGVMTALSGGLALLMVIADATIGRYGPCRIRINDSRDLEVEGGQSLLSTLKNEQIFIPSACGGRGSCGLCKVEVLSGAGAILPTELPWLTPDEQKRQIRLSCQVRVKRDLSIRIPEELFNVHQYQARVAGLRDLTYDIKEVRLQLLDPPAIDFKPGQYIQFEVPAYELTDEPIYRAYSVASGPDQHGEVELEIRYVPNGICTTYVHQHLKVGNTATINGPYGDFFLRDTNRDILFIAGGSGMAPIKSILSDMVHTKNPRRTRYCFGAKAIRDLFLVDEMRAIEKQLPDFKFIPCLSAPDTADVWNGERGLVTEVVDRTVTNLDNLEAYLCGSPLMIDACVALLKKKGLPEDRIFYDKFA